MKLKLIKNVVNNQNVDMYLYSGIGVDSMTGEGISAQQFADELNYVANYTSVTGVNVRINSPGGDVLSGIGIFSAIRNANKAGKIQVDTYNDGICASIAGIILCAGKNRFGKSFSRTMIHGVGMEDMKNATDNDKAALAEFEQMLNEVFTENTVKGSAFFSDLMKNGKDNWFTAKEAIDCGILNDFEEGADEDLEAETVIEDDFSTSAPTPGIVRNTCKKLTTYYNSLKNSFDMKRIIMRLNSRAVVKTKLSDASNEVEVESVVGEVIEENIRLTNDLDKEKREHDALKVQNETLLSEAATSAVEVALNEGKFDKTKKADLIISAKKDLPAFRALASSINAPAQRITDMINREKQNGGDLAEKIKGKTFREIERMGAKVINRLKTESIDTYVSLYNEQYKTDKTAADFK